MEAFDHKFTKAWRQISRFGSSLAYLRWRFKFLNLNFWGIFHHFGLRFWGAFNLDFTLNLDFHESSPDFGSVADVGMDSFHNSVVP
jgi:hypothetical protein